jgi:hypothetical protein
VAQKILCVFGNERFLVFGKKKPEMLLIAFYAKLIFQAMESAQLIAQNITRDINQVLRALEQPQIEVFPYSPFYVFYEQYRGIVQTAILQVKNYFLFKLEKK